MIYCVITFIKKKSCALHSSQEKWTYVYGYNQIADNVPVCVSAPNATSFCQHKYKKIASWCMETKKMPWRVEARMLTSFQIIKVGHASYLKKSCGFNSAQTVHEHRLKEAKSSQFETYSDSTDGRIVKLLG